MLLRLIYEILLDFLIDAAFDAAADYRLLYRYAASDAAFSICCRFSPHYYFRWSRPDSQY